MFLTVHDFLSTDAENLLENFLQPGVLVIPLNVLVLSHHYCILDDVFQSLILFRIT